MDLQSAVRNREEISHILINLIKRFTKIELAYSTSITPIEDQIVDGVTTKAPSQNAVYDALLTKASLSDVTSMDNALQIQLDLKANIASPTFTTGITTPAVNVSGQTASTIALFDASKNIVSASTGTYPSLTELSNLKGVTSSVQTQINAIKPYKVYIAVLSQSGTSAPTATVLENTLGGTVVWSRNSAGFYTATLSGAFTVNKFFAMSNLNYISFNANYIGVQNISRIDSNSFFIKNYLDTGSTKSLLDDLMAECFLEIRVYQ